MKAAAAFLRALGGVERGLCGLGFLVMVGALGGDVGVRLWSRFVLALEQRGWISALTADAITAGGGLLGAPQVAVMGMMAVALFGLGLAVAQGVELRARFLDGAFPQAWSAGIDRAADAAAALMMAALGGLCGMMALEAFSLGDVSNVLRWPIWPMQGMIALAFGLNALRYGLFALYPALRPVGGDAERGPA
jgi:C4-dicarboxylate transporter, DctQ subunit